MNPLRYSSAQTRRIIRELLQEVLENTTSEPLPKSLKDTYRRKGSRQTRNSQRKKRETPPQLPQKDWRTRRKSAKPNNLVSLYDSFPERL